MIPYIPDLYNKGVMREGEQLGAYRILERIGAGGMGEVWLAKHDKLGRRAAIKVLHAEHSGRTEIVHRFFNEARAATAITDPGIVQIFDFGNGEDGSAYIVMELLEGEGLDQRLKRLGSLPIGEALRIVRQVASSLGAAHAAGIVHRDLKPENIYLVRDPEVAGGERAKILDFGIAKLNVDSHVHTQTAQMMGTPAYMSPEQCRGAGTVDQRSDVYAIGCVLFTLVTGRTPFVGEGMGEVIAAQLREPAPLTSSLACGVPPALDALIDRCLAKDPNDRFGSASELALALETLLTQPAIVGATTSPKLVATAHSMSTTLSGGSMALGAAAPKRRRAKWVIGGAVILAVGAGGATFIALSSSAPAPAPALVIAPAVAPAPVHPIADPIEITSKRIVTALAAFSTWSTAHAGAPCPSATDLAASDDAWGTPLSITCTDQPADQQVGVISAGPDRVAGTRDDLASWMLGADVTAIVHGPRHVEAPPPAVKPKPTLHHHHAKPATAPAGDDIPDSR